CPWDAAQRSCCELDVARRRFQERAGLIPSLLSAEDRHLRRNIRSGPSWASDSGTNRIGKIRSRKNGFRPNAPFSTQECFGGAAGSATANVVQRHRRRSALRSGRL